MEVHIIEIWKDINGYEGYYQVSNYGQIRSLDRIITRSDGVMQQKEGQIITPIKNSDGYYQLKLCKNGKSKTCRIHQIVAHHFLEKPDDYNTVKYEINHKDYDRTNNNVDNLEWTTHIDNILHSSNHGRYKIRNFNGKNNPNYGNHILSEFYKNNPDIAKEKLGRPHEQNGKATKIELYDIEMNYITSFDWIGGCAEYLQINKYTKATVNSIRNNILKALKDGTKYLNHYYKRIA